MPRTIEVVRDGEVVEVEVDDALFDKYERFLDLGQVEGDRGFAKAYPLVDEHGVEWTLWTFLTDPDDPEDPTMSGDGPYTTGLHEFPTGVTDCRIPHLDAKRLFDRTDEVMNEFEFLDEADRRAIEKVLRG